jgi:DNA-binding transcriptional MerR regulator
MAEMFSIDILAQKVNDWCETHQISPASGQAGDVMTERNIRYYRTLGLVDGPLAGGGQGYGEKHLSQLIAIRLLQAQGLPLSRIRELLFGRTAEELKQIEHRGLQELKGSTNLSFRPAPAGENWNVLPLDDEFMLISRRGRGISAEMRERLLAVLHPKKESKRH